jgi:hypothetical protein
MDARRIPVVARHNIGFALQNTDVLHSAAAEARKHRACDFTLAAGD